MNIGQPMKTSVQRLPFPVDPIYHHQSVGKWSKSDGICGSFLVNFLLMFIRYGKYSDHAAMVVKTFGSTLRRGSKFLYQALPRLLTLWLDYSYPKPEFEEKK